MRKILPIVLLLAAAACVRVGVTPLPHAPHSRSFAAGQVDIRFEAGEIPDTCERMALLHAQGSADFTSETEMIQKLREEAGRLGANVILLRSMDEPGTGERIADIADETVAERRSESIAYFCPERLPGL